ncbi:copper homeostasis protein CutC [Aureimonas sp. AU12]|uniref:copper homeostasis protein CutC n=1 Tax=Aureimonas sp. AU12 TaxID=1638161 RepID=UPI0007823174|nr:copper homeostasis protein CutC [Aureimonas sp. AU12]
MVTLEICVDTPAGLAAAVAGGADRIELCAALSLGGLTPSAGLMHLAARVPIPVYAMIRPRAGSFVYDTQDVEAMRAEIRAVRAAGLAGVVFGASRADGTLDEAVLATLVAEAQGLGTTLHRAVDLVPDPLAAMETAIALGFERILTSGGALRAEEGTATLRALVSASNGRIAIMPGSGVRAANASAILAQTGASEIHASCRGLASGAPDPRLLRFGFEAEGAQDTDRAVVAALRAALAG